MLKIKPVIAKSLADTTKFAHKISQQVLNGGLICLYGDLGSGKTTFTKALMEKFGIHNFSVKSPTYTYIREYSKGKQKIYHMDLYRLESMDALLLEEISEILENKKSLIVIEWADKLNKSLPRKRIDVHFEYIDKNSRKITLSS